ncbi:unnamed protein product [Closterium sp. NIES-54]
MVTITTPGGQHVSICTCTRTGRHLATFARRPRSSLYTLATEPSQVAVSAQTLLWHHCLGHPSLPRLHGMHSRLLVSGLPRSLPPLSPSPAPPCFACVEGQQRTAPQSSSFPPTTAPLQTLHMDVWGPARVSGQSRERYFLLVVDDYTRYTTVFPLRSKGQVVDVLIPWIRTVRLQLRERFGHDLPVLRLHSDRGGEFSSNLLREICRGEGILQSFTLPDSPQQNGIAECRIGLVMELNLWPRVSLPETSPTLRWTGEVGDATVFRVWGSRAFVRDTFADKLSPCAIPCVFLGFVLDAPSWQFYHPTSSRVLPSQDVTFDNSVPFYRLFPYRSTPPPPPPLFLAPGPPPVDPLPPQGRAPSGVSQVDPLPGPTPVSVAVGSVAARGAAFGGAASGGAELGGAGSKGAETGGAEPGGVGTGGAEPRGAEPEGVEPGGAASEGGESGDAEPQGAASSGGSAGASPRLSPQQLREWFVRRALLRSGAIGAGGAGAARAGGVGVAAGASGAGGAAATGPGGPRTQGNGAAGTGGVEGTGVVGPGAGGAGAAGAGVGGTGAKDTGAVDPCAGGARGIVWPRPYFVPLHRQVLGTPSSTGLTPPLLCPSPDQSQLPLQPASPLPAPSPYAEQSGGLTERREPASRPVLSVRTARRAPRSRPPPVPGTHAMALRPSSVPLRVPLPAPPESSLPAVPDTKSEHACAKRHTYTDLGELRSYLGLHITRDRAQRTITLTQSHMVHQVLHRFGFQFSSPQPTPLTTSHSLSATPSDDSVEPSGLYPELVGCLMHRKVHWDAAKRVLRYLCSTSGMGLVLGGGGPIVLTGHADTSWVDDSATQRSSQSYTFSLGSGSVSWRSTRSSSVLSSSCEAEIYAGALAAQELRWLTYLLTDLGEQPRSPPILYVDNKAMITLCQEDRLEHRTKHIALQYFLAQELQQRGQLRLAYVATRANTADVFTKALLPGDHQRFVTVLGLVPTLPHLLTT